LIGGERERSELLPLFDFFEKRFMKNKLIAQLTKKHPTLKSFQVHDYVNRYVDCVMREIAFRFADITSEDIDAGEFSFAVDKVNVEVGHGSLNGKRLRVWTLMQLQTETSLVLVTYKGNSITQRVSKVTLNPRYKKEILNELVTNNFALTSANVESTKEAPNFSIPIDMDALDSYIKNTEQILPTAKTVNYKEKLIRNLLAARRIKVKAEVQDDGTYLVHEYWTQIDSGRIHGHGLSLQLASKEVRHAALGRCSRIDFKASSYAILTSIALEINPKLKVEALKSYIKYRAPIRTRIAKKVGVSEDWIKTVFTSLGFGAEVKDNPYNTIRSKLGKEKFNILVANQEFASIKHELDLVRSTILKSDQYSGDDFTLGDYTYKHIDSKTELKRNKNQKIAWIFQALERMALEIVINKMPENFTMLLPVHDCLYVKQRLPAHVLLDLKDEIRQLVPLLDFEQELIIPIHAAEDHDKFNLENDADESAHKKRIYQEEIKARGHKSEFLESVDKKESDYTNETDAEYEHRRHQQFLRDIQRHEESKDCEEE
jgi:hypothetical protein